MTRFLKCSLLYDGDSHSRLVERTNAFPYAMERYRAAQGKNDDTHKAHDYQNRREAAPSFFILHSSFIKSALRKSAGQFFLIDMRF